MSKGVHTVICSQVYTLLYVHKHTHFYMFISIHTAICPKVYTLLYVHKYTHCYMSTGVHTVICSQVYTLLYVHKYTHCYMFTSVPHVVSVPCSPGHFLNQTLSKCQPCPTGSYREDVAVLHCSPCPAGTTSRGLGTERREECLRE